MISESWFWKRELVGLLGEFETWASRSYDDWEGEVGFRLERSVFYSALAIRRLLDSNKITDRLSRSTYSFEAYPSKLSGPEKLTDFNGRDDLCSAYDFNNKNIEMFSPKKIASEIIHSFTFLYSFDEATSIIDGFFVASEKNNYKRLVFIPSCKWNALINGFIQDSVVNVSMEWDSTTRKITMIKE